MAVKMLSVVVLAATLAGSASLAQIGGPSNLPPASFKGQQFVDGRGCLFLRAGFGGTVNWVARLDRSHQPICGMPPTGSAAAQAAVAADMAPETTSAPRSASVAEVQPLPRKGFNLAGLFGTGTGAAAPSPAPAPTVMAAIAPIAPVAALPQAPASQAVPAAIATQAMQCYPDAPKLERVKIAGGTALVCTQGNGSTSGWRPPSIGTTGQAQVAPVAAQVTQPLAIPAISATRPAVQAGPVLVAAPDAPPAPMARSRALPKPPKGWTYAWNDDRLNPLRGIGTAEGQAQQDRVWQRTVPMVLVTDQVPQQGLTRLFGLKTSVSTMSAPAVAQASVRGAQSSARSLRIQIGTFGDPANVVQTTARLAALGLPVSAAPIARNGKVLQIVYAGPFASEGLASEAMTSVHSAGFADAVLR